MAFDWQTICALVVVAFATAVLLGRLYSLLASKATSGCGSCPNKPTSQSINALPLIQLDLVARSTEPVDPV